MTRVSVMAFDSGNGWGGIEFFIVLEIRQKTAFNNEVEKYFPGAKVALTLKGYMTEQSFLA